MKNKFYKKRFKKLSFADTDKLLNKNSAIVPRINIKEREIRGIYEKE